MNSPATRHFARIHHRRHPRPARCRGDRVERPVLRRSRRRGVCRPARRQLLHDQQRARGRRCRRGRRLPRPSQRRASGRPVAPRAGAAVRAIRDRSDRGRPSSASAPPPVPRAGQERPELLAGAAVERVEVNGAMQTWDEATTAFEAAVGQPITIARRFSPDFPSSFAEVEAFAVDTGVRDRFISVKGDPTFEQWTTFLDSIPADGFDTWVTINHEPENDGEEMTPDVFKAKLALMLSAIRETARPDLHPAAVLMTWLERDDDPNSSSAVVVPGRACRVHARTRPVRRLWLQSFSGAGRTDARTVARRWWRRLGGQRDRYQADRRRRRGMDRRDVRLLPLRCQLRRADVVPQRDRPGRRLVAGRSGDAGRLRRPTRGRLSLALALGVTPRPVSPGVAGLPGAGSDTSRSCATRCGWVGGERHLTARP